jgi:phospholipase/lecithinase/hemolysin
VQLDQMGRQEGWDTIDLLPAFQEGTRSQRLFTDAWHPTAAGHRLAAQVVARELACRGLLPVERSSDCDRGS